MLSKVFRIFGFYRFQCYDPLSIAKRWRKKKLELCPFPLSCGKQWTFVSGTLYRWKWKITELSIQAIATSFCMIHSFFCCSDFLPFDTSVFSFFEIYHEVDYTTIIVNCYYRHRALRCRQSHGNYMNYTHEKKKKSEVMMKSNNFTPFDSNEWSGLRT